MNQKLLHTPHGVRDIYGIECEKKNVMKEKLHHVLMQYGYHDIETPSFEFFDIFNQEKGTVSSSEMFKFFDRNNHTLVLRPDMTPSIARCVAKYYEAEKEPIRLSYIGNTFLNRVNYQGKLTEVTQIGAELVNDNSAMADAEIIVMMIDCLKASGLSEFRIEIGQVDFYKGLIEAAKISAEEEESLRRFIDNKNSFGLEKELRTMNLDEKTYQSLAGFIDLYGDVEILEKAKGLALNERSKNAILRLKEVYEILEVYGCTDYVSFDLGMLTQFDYYTGIIFKGYTYGTGDAVAKGGRYDELLSLFGKDAPSIGFVITVDELLLAIARQKIEINTKKYALFLYDEEVYANAVRDVILYRSKNKPAALVKKDKNKEIKDYLQMEQVEHIYYYNKDDFKDRFHISIEED